MSFKIGRFCYLTTSFIIGLFFLLLGIFGIVIPWAPRMQQATAQFFLEHTLILSLFGLGFILIGISILIYSLLSSRRRYIHIQTGNYAVVMDEALIQQYLESYWSKQFPNLHIPFEVSIKKKSIQIAAELPPLPLSEQKAFLEQVKNDFADLFGRILGYPHDIHLYASFQSNPSL